MSLSVMQQKVLNNAVDLASQTIVLPLGGSYVSVSVMSGWPIEPELRSILDAVDEILFKHCGVNITIWDETFQCPKEAVYEWRSIMGAYYRRIEKAKILVGIEFYPEPTLCLIPDGGMLSSIPLSDPNCFAKFEEMCLGR